MPVQAAKMADALQKLVETITEVKVSEYWTYPIARNMFLDK